MTRRKNTQGKATTAIESVLDAHIARREAEELPKSLKAFVRAVWDIVEPGTPFLDGVHIDAICDHLQMAAERKIDHLVITVPPRHTKSTLISVIFPAWVWTRAPAERFLYASYSSSLAIRDAVKSRRIIESDWYQARWPFVKIEDDQNLKSSYELTSRGGRQTTSVDGTVTGLGGSFLVVDDPHNVKDAESTSVREGAVEWFKESFYNRTTTRDTVRIVVQQRVHAKDVAGYCIADGGWTHLNLPMEFEGKAEPNDVGWVDPRTTFGELLWPARYSDKEVAKLKKTLGSYAYAGQYQQNPAPRGGGMLKREWLRFWYDPRIVANPDPVTASINGEHTDLPQKAWYPSDAVQVVASWDMAFKGGPSSDYVVGQVWAKNGADFMLLDQFRDRADFVATCEAVTDLHRKWNPLPTLVEGKANGSAVVSALRDTIPGFREVQPEGGKESRAAAIAPLLESGNVWLPHPSQAPWVGALVEELTLFPRAPNDDQVDALSQALVAMREDRADVVDLGSAFGGRMDLESMTGLIGDSYWQ